MSGFDRVFSVEDIVGGLTKMGSMGNSLNGFPRTDSDQAFQDFLKRIPSNTSLATFGSHGGSHPDIAAQAAQLHSLQAHVASQAAAAMQSSSAPPDASGTNMLGVPRVASLDFFRQLLPVNQLNVSGAKPPGSNEGEENSNEGNAHGMRRSGKVEPSAGSAFSPPQPQFQSELPPIAGVSATMPLVTSAAEPVRVQPLRAPSPSTGGNGLSGASSGGGGGGGRPTLPPMPTSAPMTEREKELQAKAELRRARRMLSNRESARRSRKRKQEHLGELQGQIAVLTEQKEELEDELESARALLKRRDTEISQLRQQNEQLREHLDGGQVQAPKPSGKGHSGKHQHQQHQQQQHHQQQQPGSPKSSEKPPLAGGGKVKRQRRDTKESDS